MTHLTCTLLQFKKMTPHLILRSVNPFQGFSRNPFLCLQYQHPLYNFNKMHLTLHQLFLWPPFFLLNLKKTLQRLKAFLEYGSYSDRLLYTVTKQQLQRMNEDIVVLVNYRTSKNQNKGENQRFGY